VIEVTKLNGRAFLINALLIETVESMPDTKITLTNGHSYIVKESSKEVEHKITAFYRSVSLLGRNTGEVGPE
jgi:flagellar protein FlbD